MQKRFFKPIRGKHIAIGLILWFLGLFIFLCLWQSEKGSLLSTFLMFSFFVCVFSSIAHGIYIVWSGVLVSNNKGGE